MKTLANFLAIVLATAFSWPVMASQDAAIFMYHRFGEDRFPATNVRVEQLEEQLELLASDAFNVVSLQDLLDAWNGGPALPDNAVVITVDDAYESVYSVAFPRMVQAGFPFTVFVSTNPVDQNFAGYMSWDQMREMGAAGVTFANHGADHLYMVRREEGEDEAQWLARIRADIEGAQERLDEELAGTGSLIRNAFAYPYGEYNTALAGMLKDMGYLSFGQQSGAAGPGSDRRALPRYPVAEAFSELSEFRTKARSRPFPVASITPWDPVTNRQPLLTVRLNPSDARLDALACFVSRQGRVEVQWLEDGQSFEVGPASPLGRGRSRVNCTAPDPAGRFYWFSHQWIVQ